jgi:uncharacterized coiled-coil protein SlyX
MRQLAASEAARKEAEATASALRSSGRKETRRLQAELEALSTRLHETEMSAEQAAEDVRQGETEAVAMLRDTNARLRERVRQLTQQLKSLGGRAYAQPVPRPGRAARSSSSSVGSRASGGSARGRAASGRSASVGSRAGSVGSSVASRGSSRASSGRGGARFDPTAYIQQRKQRISERRAGRKLPHNSRLAEPAGTPNSGRSGFSARSGASRASAASSVRDRPLAVGASSASGFNSARTRPPRAGTGAAAVRARPSSAMPKRAHKATRPRPSGSRTGARAAGGSSSSSRQRARGTATAAEPAGAGGSGKRSGKSGVAARGSKTARASRGAATASALAAAVARGGSRGKIWERSPSVGSTGSRGSAASSARRRRSGKTGRKAADPHERHGAGSRGQADAGGFSEAVAIDEAGHRVEPDALDLLGVSGAPIGTREAPRASGSRATAHRSPAMPPPVEPKQAWGDTPAGGAGVDAGSELTDIDSRLRALQTFLRQAKSSSNGSGQRQPGATY